MALNREHLCSFGNANSSSAAAVCHIRNKVEQWKVEKFSLRASEEVNWIFKTQSLTTLHLMVQLLFSQAIKALFKRHNHYF